MCLERTGTKPVGKGPICVTVDTSGSMSGDPVETAKAIALTMAYIARKQNRWCALIDYSGGEQGEVLALRPGEWDDEALCIWLEHFYGRGSYLDIPLRELPTRYWPQLLSQGLPRGKTDLIMITDALAEIPESIADRFNQWRREEQVNVTGVIIKQKPGDLVSVCDRIHRVPALSETDSTAAILFSL